MKLLKNPRFLMIVSMIIFGTIGLFKRYISISSGELALYRAILAALLIFIFICFNNIKINLKSIKKEIPLLVISGMAMGINWIFLFEAYNYTSVSSATLSYYFAPIIVTIVSPILFKEKMGIIQIVCFIMSTLGIALISINGENSKGVNDSLGIIFGLCAAVFYATVIILNKYLKTIDGISRTFLQFIFAIVILLPYTLFTSGINLNTLESTEWIFLLIIGLVHTGITYCMYFTALKELPGQKAAILSYLDPLVAVLISVFILKEYMHWWQIIGGVLILGFTLINELYSSKKIIQ